MGTIVDIPGVGQVEFPDGMSNDDISSAIQNNILKKEEPTFLGDLKRSAMRGKQQLDIATTIMGRELGIHSDDETAKLIAKDTAEAAQYQPSQRLKNINKEAEQDKSFGDVLKRYADRPIYDSLRYVTNLVAESLVPSVVAGGAGALAGAAVGSAVPVVGPFIGARAGLGLGSGALEYASTILDRLSDKVDVTNPEAVKAFLSNPEKMEEARKSGLLRGIPIGVVDGITAGAAGRFMAPLRAAEQAGKVVGKGSKVAAGLKEMGMQMAGGAAGEAAAGALEKGEINPKAVADEAIAEIPSGILETILGVKFRGKKKPTAQDAYSISDADVEDAIRQIKQDHAKEVELFDKAAKEAGIPADMANAMNNLRDKAFSPATTEEDLQATIEDIKKQWPTYDPYVDGMIPTLTKIRTRGDAIGKLTKAVGANRSKTQSDMLSDLRDVFAEQDQDKANETGLSQTMGAITTPEEAKASRRDRADFAQGQQDFRDEQLAKPAESAVPLVPEEQVKASQAASTEAQQNAELAAAGPNTIREVPKSTGENAYQIVGDNNKTNATAIQTRSEAERRAAELNAADLSKVSESGPAIKTAEAAKETLKPTELTPTEQTVKAAKDTMAPETETSPRLIKDVADTYFASLKEYRNADPSILMADMEKAGVRGFSLKDAKALIEANKPRQKSNLAIDNIFSDPDLTTEFNTTPEKATDIVNKYLEEMAGRGKQGEMSAAALRDAIFNKNFDANQALTALKIVRGVERVMGNAAKNNPVAIRFLKQGESPAARTTIDDKAVNSVLEFSLAPDALPFAGQNASHEAMHVLQDLFQYVDPEAHRVLSKAFKPGMKVNDIPSNIVNFLRKKKNPETGKSYWDTMQPALEKADINNNELMAYTFGAIDEIMRTNPGNVPPVGGAFTRFFRFVKDAVKSIKDSMFGGTGAKALDIMKELSSGYRQSNFKDAPLRRMGEGKQNSNLSDKEKAFNKLADDQRGKPESAMLKVHNIMSGGVLPHAVEHVGDITHRMSQYGGSMANSYVPTKVRSALDSLRNKYGFEKEHKENVESAARFRNEDPKELNEKLNNALSEYANEHKKLQVYNAMQDHAREAAVSLGERNFKKAENHLSAIDRAIKSGMYAKQVQEYNPNYQRRIHPDLQEPVTLDIKQKSELAASNKINEQIIRQNSHLNKLTAEEGVRMSKTYGDYVKEFFNPYHMLGKGADKFRVARALMTGDISRFTEEINALVKDIADAKGDKFAISRYLTTKDANPMGIKDEKARKAAVETKKLINKIGDELVRRNLITAAEREDLRDQYLPRVYLAYAQNKKFVTGGHKPGFMYYLKPREELTPEQRARLGEIEDPAFLVQEALFAPMRDMAVLNYFAKLNKIGGDKWILGMDKMKYRNARGSVLDLSLPELKTFAARLDRQLKNGEIAPDRVAETNAEIRNINDFVKSKEAQLRANVDEGNYIQMPKDDERFGPLAGLWMAAPIYRDIMGIGSFMPNNMSGLAALFTDGSLMSKATSVFKLSKVAANPPTIATNIISNALMMHLAGIPIHRILPSFGTAFKELVMDKKGKYYDLAHRYGLKETTLSEQELKNLYAELDKRKIDGASDLTKMTGMVNALRKASWHKIQQGGKALSDFYGGIETVFKTAMIKDAIENQGMTEEQAVLYANKYLFDYSEVHDSIKALRNIPFGAPFITWSYKMTPLLIETALTKPWRLAPYAMLFYGVGVWAASQMAAAGGSDDDKDKIKKFIAKKTAENPFVLATSPTDVVDFGKFMPFNNMYKFGAAASKGNFVEALKAFGFFGGPIADIGVFLTTGKDPFTNRDVVPKGATWDEDLVLRINFLANVFTPPFLKDLPKLAAGVTIDDPELTAQSESVVANAIKKATGMPGGKDPGMPVKSWSDIIASFFGVNIYHPSVMQFAKNVKTFETELSAITADMNNSLSDPSLRPEDRRKIVDKYIELRKKKAKELADYVKDANLSPAIFKIAQESVTGVK